MDSSQLHILRETGIICETHTLVKLSNRYSTLLVGSELYQLTSHHYNFYQISRLPKNTSNKKTNPSQRKQYLLCSDGSLDWVIKPDNIDLEQYFEPQSLFEIAADNICCTLFPKSLSGYVLCLDRDIILNLKKWSTCLQGNYQTIFQYQPLVPILNNSEVSSNEAFVNKSENRSKSIPTNLVNLSSCNPLATNSLEWLVVVTNRPHQLPDYLQRRVWTNKLPSSLLYLDYIIKNYNTMSRVVFFLDKIPLTRKYDGMSEEIDLDFYLTGPGSGTGKLISTVDTRINLAETRMRYRCRSQAEGLPGWTSWYNYTITSSKFPKKINQEMFWSHLVQYPLTQNIIDFPSNNTYYIPSQLLLKHSRDWYQGLQNRLNRVKDYSMSHLDRIWYTLLA